MRIDLSRLRGYFLSIVAATIGPSAAQQHTLPAVASDTFALLAAAQTLTNKTVNLTSNTLSGTTAQFNTALSDNDFATLAGAETLTNKTVALGSNTVSGTTAQFNTALSDNDFATLAGAETLTNKTVSLGSNTLTGTTAQFNTALTDNDFATLAGSEVLTNKTIALGSNTVSGTLAQFNTAVTDADLASLAGAEALTNKTIALGSNTVSGTTAQFNTALTDNDFATLAGSEVLTNKTVNLASNTLSGTTAQFNTALSDNDFTTLAGIETLTNKTLTTPTINGAALTGTLSGTPTFSGLTTFSGDAAFTGAEIGITRDNSSSAYSSAGTLLALENGDLTNGNLVGVRLVAKDSGGTVRNTGFLVAEVSARGASTTTSNLVFRTANASATPATRLILGASGAGADVTGNSTIAGTLIQTASGAQALAVGRAGATDPVFEVDSSVVSAATGLTVKGQIATGGVNLTARSSGTDEGLKIDAKGTGALTFQGTATGGIILTRDATFSAKIIGGAIGPVSGQQHTLPAVASDTVALLAAAQALTNKTIDFGSNTMAGTLAVARGGTGQNTAEAAFYNLSPLTALGDVIYGSAINTATRLAGNITTTRKFLAQTGDGVLSAAPVWDTVTAAAADQNPTLLVQAADYNLPANYGLVVQEYEIGSGFVLDLASGSMMDVV